MSDTEAEAIAGLVTVPFVQGDYEDIEALQLVAHSEGWIHELVDNERFLAHPRRKRGTVTLRDGMSFAQYVNAQKTPETMIFADGIKLTAIFNHHEPSSTLSELAGWNDHRAEFEMKFTPSWTAWTGFDDHWQTQQDFAEFLEERIPDIADPPGADLLEIVRTLRMKVETHWENVIVLQNDAVQMKWVDEVSTGDVKIPENITLYCPRSTAPRPW